MNTAWKHSPHFQNLGFTKLQRVIATQLELAFAAWISWGFILLPRLPEKSNFAHRNSFSMSHVISLWLVRSCNLQVLTSCREMSFELKGNRNLIRYSDLSVKVAFFRKCDAFFRSPNLQKKIFRKAFLSLKFKFHAKYSKQQIQISSSG